MFGNVIGGITNYLAYQYEMTQALSSWLMGHFSLVLKGRYEIVWLTVPLVVLAFLFALKARGVVAGTHVVPGSVSRALAS